MGWDFETDPDFQVELDWADEFVREKVEPVDLLVEHPWDVSDPRRNALIEPLQEQVKARGLWGTHLGPELGGPGYGQVKLALLNEILGRSWSAPIVFGCHAPDSGNSEILAHFGTDLQKDRFLEPLLDGRIVSCYSMTEPHGGADPKVFTTRARKEGDEWVLDGEKWFSSHARFASFLIVLAVTDPDAPPYERFSTFLVPRDTPGVELVRDVGLGDEPAGHGVHAYMRYTDVRLPADSLLGERGGGFVVAQTRLGGGRVHHAMRTVGLARRALEMMYERAVSRHTQGEMLGDKQLVQQAIADSWIQLEQFRLLVLRTAWRIDRLQDYRQVRGDIAAIKAAMPTVLHDIAARALHLHGSIGASNEMPLASMVLESFHMGLADGPTEVHKLTLARQLLRDRKPADGLFPSGHLPSRRAAAEQQYADVLAALDG